MKKMSIIEARQKFSEVVNQVAYGSAHIVLTRRGKPMAAIVSLEDLKKINSTKLEGVHNDSKARAQ